MLFLLLTLTATDTTIVRRVEVAPGEVLSVTITGEGEPVVLVPGLFGSSYGFRRVSARLAEAGFRSVGIEPLGIGLSSRTRDADYSLTAQADRVAAAMDSLGVRNAVFVAHSLGASIAMRVAYRRPDLVRGLVSVEGGPGEEVMTRGMRRWMRFADMAAMLNVRALMTDLLRRDMRRVSFDTTWIADSIVRGYTAGMGNDSRLTMDVYLRMAESEEPELLRDHLGTIACPVVLLVGAKRHLSGPPSEEVTLMRDELPQFAMDTVPESGFFVQEEQPSAIADHVGDIAGAAGCAGAPGARQP